MHQLGDAFKVMSTSRKAIEPSMRKAIRAELAMVEPHDSLEQEHIAEALAWVDSGAELCRISKPATPPNGMSSKPVARSR
jgi:8-oxo-dGTP diphosphatase